MTHDRGVKGMVEMKEKISEFLKSPVKNYNIEESREILRQCGILDNNNMIKKEYKKIIVKLC